MALGHMDSLLPRVVGALGAEPVMPRSLPKCKEETSEHCKMEEGHVYLEDCATSKIPFDKCLAVLQLWLSPVTGGQLNHSTTEPRTWGGLIQRIGLRENLQETPRFHGKDYGFPCFFHDFSLQLKP